MNGEMSEKFTALSKFTSPNNVSTVTLLMNHKILIDKVWCYESWVEQAAH